MYRLPIISYSFYRYSVFMISFDLDFYMHNWNDLYKALCSIDNLKALTFAESKFYDEIGP